MAELDFLSCPYCDYGRREFLELQNHIQTAHESRQERRSTPRELDDFELAQLLAFEEAGLPSELALSEMPDMGNVNQVEETAMPEDRDSSRQKVERKPWADCFCGERVPFRELDAHSDMHAQETVSLDEGGSQTEAEFPTGPANGKEGIQDVTNAFTTSISKHIRNHDQMQQRTPTKSDKRRVSSLQELFFGLPSLSRKSPKQAITKKEGRSKRLGRAELGPYAHEKQMPGWLRRMLEEGAKVTITNQIDPNGNIIKVKSIANETPNLIPVLAGLSQLDHSVERALYCSPNVRHIAKMAKEGGFCGYRNIQMMISYIRDAKATGNEHFKGKIPSILSLQDLIEQAWDTGHNSSGRVETGGIKFTRKYIGTPEAQALFTSLEIPCEASAFTTTEDVQAYEAMLYAVCEYFDEGKDPGKVIVTEKPPIYFQHQGHSMTIVGVEIRSFRRDEENHRTVNLVVFDPMFNPSAGVKKLIDSNSFRCNDPARLLKAHRRGEGYLSRYRDFELLRLKER